MTTHIVEVKSDATISGGAADSVQYFIEIPPDFLEKLGWMEGDEIEFDIRKDGTIHLNSRGWGLEKIKNE